MTPPYRAKEDVVTVRREDWEALVRALRIAHKELTGPVSARTAVIEILEDALAHA